MLSQTDCCPPEVLSKEFRMKSQRVVCSKLLRPNRHTEDKGTSGVQGSYNPQNGEPNGKDMENTMANV